MRINKIIALVLFFPLFLIGCSNQNVSENDISNLTNSISFPNLEKVEFDSKNKTLIFYTNDEFIAKDDVNKIIDNISLNNKKGFEALTFDNFNKVANNIEIISINKNKVNISFENVSELNMDIVKNFYSEHFMSLRLKEISEKIVTFNSLAGKIETSLKQGNFNQELVNDFNTEFLSLDEQVGNVINLISGNKLEGDFSSTESLLNKVIYYSKLVKSGVDNAAFTKDFNSINNNFLNINELDKISRDIQK